MSLLSILSKMFLFLNLCYNFVTVTSAVQQMHNVVEKVKAKFDEDIEYCADLALWWNSSL